MASNKKKNVDEMRDSDGETDTTSDDDDGPNPEAYTGNEVVQVEFEGRSPIDPDCHGIAQLLSRLFLKAHIGFMAMAELIIAQNFVGSVICQCEDDLADSDSDDNMCEDGTIFGITTVLNITSKKSNPCIEQLRSYILHRAEKNATDAVLKNIRHVLSDETSSVGFLINERFINIPVQISVPLLENLNSEINTAKLKKMNFHFVHFLMIVKFYRKKARKGKPAEDTYSNAEEEIFAEKAVASFEYSVADECDSGLSGDWLEGDATLTPFRKVLLLDANQFPHIINDIKQLIQQ